MHRPLPFLGTMQGQFNRQQVSNAQVSAKGTLPLASLPLHCTVNTGTHPTPQLLGKLAVQAALCEAATAPKPGLVCPHCSGAHKDMNIHTMYASALSLQAYFTKAVQLGYNTAGVEAKTVFLGLRKLGVEAEATMLAATGGVNTHKGLIFSLGLILAAAGRNMALALPLSAPALCTAASAYIQGIVAADFGPLHALRQKIATQAKSNTAHSTKAKLHSSTAHKHSNAVNRHNYILNTYYGLANQYTGTITPPDCAQSLLAQGSASLGRKLSAGERLYLLYGITGIRGEAEGGFAHLLAAKSYFDTQLAAHGINVAAVHSLLFLMSVTQDTNILHRGGPNALARVQHEAAQALRHGGLLFTTGQRVVKRLERTCLKLNVSPGGCADMLALLYFFYLLNNTFTGSSTLLPNPTHITAIPPLKPAAIAFT